MAKRNPYYPCESFEEYRAAWEALDNERKAEIAALTHKLAVANKVVDAARRMLERIDFNGGIGEYKGGPSFVVKDLRESLAALEALGDSGV